MTALLALVGAVVLTSGVVALLALIGVGMDYLFGED